VFRRNENVRIALAPDFRRSNSQSSPAAEFIRHDAPGVMDEGGLPKMMSNAGDVD
jgi:hypothetical protein